MDSPDQSHRRIRLDFRHPSTPDSLEGATFGPAPTELAKGELRLQLRTAFQKLRVDDAPAATKKWWKKFAKHYQNDIPEALKICNAILACGGTAEEFYRTVQSSGGGSFISISQDLDYFVEKRKFLREDEFPERPPFLDS